MKRRWTIGSEILAAQEPDGYLQTAWTLRNTNVARAMVAAARAIMRANAGYFIESAINHYRSPRKRQRLTTRRKNGGLLGGEHRAGKKEWLTATRRWSRRSCGSAVRERHEGHGHGDSYNRAGEISLDAGSNGGTITTDQSPSSSNTGRRPRRARVVSFLRHGGCRRETGDVDYQSAVMSLWDISSTRILRHGGIAAANVRGLRRELFPAQRSYNESCVVVRTKGDRPVRTKGE